MVSDVLHIMSDIRCIGAAAALRDCCQVPPWIVAISHQVTPPIGSDTSRQRVSRRYSGTADGTVVRRLTSVSDIFTRYESPFWDVVHDAPSERGT